MASIGSKRSREWDVSEIEEAREACARNSHQSVPKGESAYERHLLL